MELLITLSLLSPKSLLKSINKIPNAALKTGIKKWFTFIKKNFSIVVIFRTYLRYLAVKGRWINMKITGRARWEKSGLLSINSIQFSWLPTASRTSQYIENQELWKVELFAHSKVYLNMKSALAFAAVSLLQFIVVNSTQASVKSEPSIASLNPSSFFLEEEKTDDVGEARSSPVASLGAYITNYFEKKKYKKKKSKKPTKKRKPCPYSSNY